MGILDSWLLDDGEFTVFDFNYDIHDWALLNKEMYISDTDTWSLSHTKKFYQEYGCASWDILFYLWRKWGGGNYFSLSFWL
jgi:hypothetical protein